MMEAAVQEELVTKMLRLAPKLRLPTQTVTEKIGILGATGSGKTTTASTLVEEMLKQQLPVEIVDPTDAWWGLRSSKDGKSEGYAVTVLGGDYGDLPLEETAGKLIADLVADQAPPLVISLAHFSNAAIRRYMADFLERLYERNRRALHLVLDETDLLAPQDRMKMKGGGERLYGAVDTLVRRGRKRGLGTTLISQRSAEISKSILSQCSTLFAHRASHPTDVDPILDWMKYHAKARIDDVRETIASLADGEAWVMSPERLKLFERVQMRDRETFNSSKTPEPGEEEIVPKRLAKPDLEQLREAMKETIEKAAANDPAMLRRKVSDLQAHVKKLEAAKAPPAPAKVETKRVEVPVLKDAQVERLETAIGRFADVTERLSAVAAHLGDVAGALRADLARAAAQPVPPRSAAPNTIPVRSAPPRPVPARRASSNGAAGDEEPGLGSGERAVLTAIAQHSGGVDREQLTVLTGYKRATRNTYLQRLGARGLVAPQGDRFVATDAGLAVLGPDFEPLPTGPALLERWRHELPTGERAVLEVVVAAYPEPVDREKITELTQYQRATRNTYLQRLGARKLVEDAGRGLVRASDTLFET